jgi:hypothetical protein
MVAVSEHPGETDTPDAAAEPKGTGYDPKYLHAAFAAVPESGKGRRWYDYPYRFLSWLLSGWRRRLFPRPVRLKINYLRTLISRFNDHQRNQAWSRDDPMHVYSVPEDERVAVPSIWVVELFPPSRFDSLRAACARNSWDKRRVMGHLERNDTLLEESRSGRGMSWWPLVEISDPGSGPYFPDGVVEKLPPQFASAQLHAVSVGSGLTAVVARFTVDPSAVDALNDVWHTEHPSTLYWEDGQLHSKDPQWSGFRITQKARRVFHDAGREWMREKVPGFFASTGEPQLLTDLVLTTEFDPTGPDAPPREMNDVFRALGLTDYTVEHRTSASLPGLLLCPLEANMCPDMGARNTWTLFGRRDTVKDAAGDLSFYGSDTDRAIAHAVDRTIRMFLIALSLSAYADAAKAQHATLRDNATSGNRRFSSRQLKRLRKALMTLSLDLAGMERDVRDFWAKAYRYDPLIEFAANLAPWIIARDVEEGRHPHPPFDLNEYMRKQQRKDLRGLVEADTDYRDILGTVSNLGASVSATRVGRAALGVAAASLIVSAVTLAVNDSDDGSSKQPSEQTEQPTPTPSPSAQTPDPTRAEGSEAARPTARPTKSAN